MPTTMPTVEQLAALPTYLRKTIPPEYKDAMGHMNIRWYMALYDDGSEGSGELVYKPA